ncbi:RND family efflux transporter, MFP subunit [Caulobacter sp. AP07]|uniref:efflux RND transporter periplasmic adaptor subunit n=1 Tax=Caulobacter sp. AP07 TaxID=1144304 RepID=UPI000271F2AD|nr:efflux RND transporter periplasmic adaptor subunit [Caulobacter sp. AP07]EJL30832.1 RND family efflux transporter, MFP subunit [Caulobacter sp. AP07]
MAKASRIARTTSTAVLALMVCACHGGEPAATPPAVVSTTTPTVNAVLLTDDLPGRVSAFRTAEIRPQVAGLVRRRLFEEGALVRAGQPLFQIDPATFRVEADIAAGALRRAEAVRIQARLQAQRMAPLVETDAVSRQTYDNAVSALAQADADLLSARATLARRRLDLNFSTVTAPISGRIGAASVTEGALVAQGQTDALATVQQIDRVYVDVRQPAARLLALRDAGGGGSPQVELLDADGKPMGLSGRLLFSEVAVDPGTGDLRARIEVDNRTGRLLPGMFVRARLPRGPARNLPSIPQQAVSFSGGKPQVVVIQRGGQAASRPVTLGPVVDNRYVVLAGLQSDDVIVVEGRDHAASGQPFKVTPWRGAASIPTPTQAPQD